MTANTTTVLPDARAHNMVPGGYGHGLSHCEYCKATDREIAFALGPVCPNAPTPPASDAAVSAGERWTIEGVMAEMLAVAAASIEAEQGDQILEDWPLDCRADVDRWQSVITRALAAAPKVASDTQPDEQWMNDPASLEGGEPKVASDTGAGLDREQREGIVTRAVNRIMTGFSFSTLEGPENLRARLSMCARQAVEDTIAALSTDATDGATGGGEVR